MQKPADKPAPRRWPAAAAVAAVLLGVYLVYAPDGVGPHGHARHTECGIPIEAFVGTVDPEFGFGRVDVERALAEAAALWQTHSTRALFVADEPRRRMPVDLVLDERQVTSNEMRRRQQTLERQESALRELQDRYITLQRQLAADGEAYRRAELSYEERAAEHARRVGDWNAGRVERSAAGASRLRDDTAALESERERLADERSRLNARVSATNHMAEEVQRELAAFNSRVAAFNREVGASPVTAGGYAYHPRDGRRITIYRANDYEELVLLLAHELGHALGIGHVAARDAVMHQEITDVPLPVRALSDADVAALAAACGR